MKKRFILLLLIALVFVIALILLQIGKNTPQSSETNDPHRQLSKKTNLNKKRSRHDKKILETFRNAQKDSKTYIKRKQIIRAGWGAEKGQMGRLRAQESNPEGPMSLALNRKGQLSLLDQVNGRIERFDQNGKLLSDFPIGTTTAQDVLITPDDTTLVLDRLAKDPVVKRFDTNGNPLGEISLARNSISNKGDISGIFSDKNGIYIEVGHHKVIRISDADGNSVSTDEEIPGRPTRDGSLAIRAGILNKQEGKVYVHAHSYQNVLAWEKAYRLAGPIRYILMLDSDLLQHIYLAAEIQDITQAEASFKTMVIRLDQKTGTLSGQLILPSSLEQASECFKPLSVGDDGTIYQILHQEEGTVVYAYRFEN